MKMWYRNIIVESGKILSEKNQEFEETKKTLSVFPMSDPSVSTSFPMRYSLHPKFKDMEENLWSLQHSIKSCCTETCDCLS